MTASEPLPSGDSVDPVLAGARVLIIEDEVPVANFLRDTLAAMGVEARVAHDGQSGLEEFLARQPDLVFCDLLIPKRNGFQLIDDFRQLAPAVPVVAMSGVYRRDRYEDQLAHASLFLTKPLDVVHVHEAADLLRTHLIQRGERTASAEPETDRAPGAAARRREPWLPVSILPIPRLLQVLRADRRTGMLTVRSEEKQVIFMIENGRLQFARTNDERMRLDRVLVQLGRITPEQLEAAQAELAGRMMRARLGEVLVEQGALSLDDLDRALHVQLRRIVGSAFRMADAETLFRAESLSPGEDVVADASLRDIILAGCLAMRDQGTHLLAHMPDGACMVTARQDGADSDLKLPAAVAHLVEAATEPVRLSDLISMAELLGLRGHWIAFGLLCSGTLAVCDDVESWREAAAKPSTTVPVTSQPVEAILDLARGNATGTLRVRCGSSTAWLAFSDGAIVQGGSSDAGARLGGLLRQAGLVTPQQVEAALSAQSSRPGKPLGQVLVEMGLLSATALRTAVPAQVMSVARDLMCRATWDEATFADGERPERPPIRLDASIEDLALAAVREMDEPALWATIRGLAAARPTLDLDALRQGAFRMTEDEEIVVDALGTDLAMLLASLEQAEDLDVHVLRVVAMALMATAPAELLVTTA